MTQHALLDIADLRVSFDTRAGRLWAVRGVDLRVAQGETLAVVGESGSGKSVTMMAALGLLPDNADVTGSVRFAGKELTTLPDRDLRAVRGREIGVVFQDPMSSLNPVHTVGHQIAESLRVHAGQSARQATTRAVELLDEVGIPDAGRRAGDYPHHFSGGMRQRVMIAMALACRPRLLIADEPTTALDVTVQAQIVELVQRLQRDHGMGVVWITHDLGVVAQMADRVTVMYGGRVVETSDCADLYGAPAHPYTVGLLTAVPSLESPAANVLTEIPGAPPDPLSLPPGCSFSPRCPLAEERCVEERPELLAVSGQRGDRLSACWRIADTLAGRAVPHRPPMAAPEATARGDGGRLLEVEDLKVHFGSRSLPWRRHPPVRAVDGVSLDLAVGETVGLVGESGSGKSTLGRCLVGIERPTEGTVRVGGDDVARTSGREVRRRVQMVFQDPASSMNPSLTVGEVVAEPLRINRIGTRAERRERVRELLGLVELPADCVGRHPHEFSGGQRQRIAIARALALDPSLVVCDEAVSALDVSVQAQVVNLLRRLQTELGLGLLFIAHDLAVVRNIADRVAVMYLGRIVELGTREDVYERPRHPYTRALLDAVPVADPRRRREHRPLSGDLPSPTSPPTGCRFSTRCPVAVRGLCDVEEPQLRTAPSGHLVACHLAEPDPPYPPSAAPAHDRTVRR
ncbi:MAG: dipeptide ABC transporter ATP-binding protein [Actinomycetota bacterium]